MRKLFLGRILFFFFLLFCSAIRSQTISGTVIDGITGKSLPSVHVKLSGSVVETFSDPAGLFLISETLPAGNYILSFSKASFMNKHFPVNISSENIHLGEIVLYPDLPENQQQISVVALEDLEFEEEGASAYTSGLLQASKDVFLNAAAFDFSPAFFRPRGYDSEYSKVLINGIEMNKVFNGRPLWSNWGGLNDVQRNQEFSAGLSSSNTSFGGPAGTTNIIMRASQYTYGGKFSYAMANRSYSGRAMGSYYSGVLPSGWAYSLSLSRRFARQSYIEGSTYDANSLFASVEKKINETHSINFTGIYAPSSRGRNSPNSQEVFDLKGQKYNSYWGWDDGELKNSRIREVEEPILMLNHFWNLNKDLEINSSLAYQFGKTGNSRIDYGGSRAYASGSENIYLGGGSNPDPTYYQKLPSYFLRQESNADYRSAYLAEQDFRKNGQMNWAELYLANQTSASAGGNAIYALYEDRNDDSQLTATSNFRYTASPALVFLGAMNFCQLQSKNFASVLDLFGAATFLDIDSFSKGTAAQNDLQNPNRLVSENDIFKYHYLLSATKGFGFLQAEYSWKKIEAYTAIEGSGTSYQRTGYFQNGNFPENSLGEGKELVFGNYGLKSGATYKISGRHYLITNLSYFTRPPALRNSFSNARQNNDVVLGLKNERILSADAGYTLRSPFLSGRISGFYGLFEDATEVSFYYADGLAATGREVTNAFVQEILTGIGRQHMGLEFGLEIPLNSTLKVRSAGSLGKYTYNRNPLVYLTSNDFAEVRNIGEAKLKDYRLPVGPQQAIQAGLEYRDPAYWWISASANLFSKSFIDVAPLPRTNNFSKDLDGLPLLGYDEATAMELLKQEEFGSYMLVNMVSGKSWRLKNRYVGFFGSLNNILNTTYKTGGFEQSRNVNYKLLKEDMQREKPLFGPKYWFGAGTTYYAHVYYRF